MRDRKQMGLNKFEVNIEGNMRILVVEDDLINRMVIQKFLSEFGQCDSAVNGIEAVNAFTMALTQGEPYDLICMDIMMPEMDGNEALIRIREMEKEFGIHPQDEVKIMMVTALDTPKEVIHSFYNGGCTSYIVKPLLKEKLISKIKEMGLVE